jgi:hypothetical protein
LESLIAAEVSVIAGHTYIQGLFCWAAVNQSVNRVLTAGNQESWEFQLQAGATYMINPDQLANQRR